MNPAATHATLRCGSCRARSRSERRGTPAHKCADYRDGTPLVSAIRSGAFVHGVLVCGEHGHGSAMGWAAPCQPLYWTDRLLAAGLPQPAGEACWTGAAPRPLLQQPYYQTVKRPCDSVILALSRLIRGLRNAQLRKCATAQQKMRWSLAHVRCSSLAQRQSRRPWRAPLEPASRQLCCRMGQARGAEKGGGIRPGISDASRISLDSRVCAAHQSHVGSTSPMRAD